MNLSLNKERLLLDWVAANEGCLGCRKMYSSGNRPISKCRLKYREDIREIAIDTRPKGATLMCQWYHTPVHVHGCCHWYEKAASFPPELRGAVISMDAGVAAVMRDVIDKERNVQP